jgi:hypothetical protein
VRTHASVLDRLRSPSQRTAASVDRSSRQPPVEKRAATEEDLKIVQSFQAESRVYTRTSNLSLVASMLLTGPIGLTRRECAFQTRRAGLLDCSLRYM